MLRPWHFKIVLQRGSATAVYLQIALAVIEEIKRGRLAPGTVLPSTRELAESLEVNRKTVVLAYEELVAQGWLSTEKSRGTFVSSELPLVKSRTGSAPAIGEPHPRDRPDFPLTGQAPNLQAQLQEKGVLVFDDGAPDTRLVPVDHLARAWRHALVGNSRQNSLGYGDPRGGLPLRRAVSFMLNSERGLTTTTDNICITRGSQMGIYVAARVLVRPGDTVVLEELSYPPAREAFRAAGAEVLAVGLDAQGMKVDELEKLCRRRRVRAVYVTPHHQFPTTVLLRPDRRLRLLALAEQFGFAIVEDDYDHEFHFTHRPMLPLASIDHWDKVVYIGSMSKLLAPSLRIGYLGAPAEFIERAAAEVMLIDRQGDTATESAVAELMEDGEIRRHTNKARRIYSERRQVMADLLQKHFSDSIDFTLPEGGLAVWVRFRNPIDMNALTTAAEAEQVRFLPGQIFSISGKPVSATRLGFGRFDQKELADAVRRLRRAVEQVDQN